MPNPHRDLTKSEIHAREQVWLAMRAGIGLELSAEEVKDLHESILQTGRELCWLRQYEERGAVVIDFSFA